LHKYSAGTNIENCLWRATYFFGDPQKKMSDSEDEDLNQLDEENMEQCKQERQMDEDETDFHFWMTEQNLPLPIEQWHLSEKNTSTQVPTHRLQLLQEAAEYYTNIYGGNKVNVLAEMITYFN
tara:strand:+ start:502 stop:870 length:369 start_codon:yes stop_codon:yes gene_type:complete